MLIHDAEEGPETSAAAARFRPQRTAMFVDVEEEDPVGERSTAMDHSSTKFRRSPRTAMLDVEEDGTCCMAGSPSEPMESARRKANKRTNGPMDATFVGECDDQQRLHC